MYEYYTAGVQRLVDKIADAGKMYEEVLHFIVIQINGKVVRTSRGPALQYGYDVRDFVLGLNLRFDRRLETCRRRRSGEGGGYVQFELGRKWELVRITIRTFRDTGHLGGCSLGLASGYLSGFGASKDGEESRKCKDKCARY